MRTVRSYLAVAAPLTAVFAVGLCAVHTFSAPSGLPAAMTTASAVRTDGDSGWSRSATVVAAVTSTDDHGDSGWG